jgi:hypothetical protein
LRSFSFRNLSLVMKTSGSSAIATHCPSACLKRGSDANAGGLYDSNSPSPTPAANVHDRRPGRRRAIPLPHSRAPALQREKGRVHPDPPRFEFLKHRLRPFLADRIDVDRIGGAARAAASARPSNAAMPNERALR